MYPNEQSNSTANPLVVGAVGQVVDPDRRTDDTATNLERERFEDEGFVSVTTDLDPPRDDADDEIDATRAEIEETRDHLAATVDAIREKLSPANLVEEAKEATKGAVVHAAEDVVDSVKDKASGIVESVKEKASDLMAAASGMIGSVTGKSHDNTTPVTTTATVYKTSPAASPSTAGSLTTTIGDKAATLRASALDAATAAQERLAPRLDAAALTARRAGDTAKTTGDILVETIKLNPLPAAIAGFGLGWLILSARRTQEERVRYTPDPIYNDRSYGEYTVATTQTALVPTTTEPSHLGKVKDKVGDATATVSQFTTEARDKAASAAAEARNKAAAAAAEARDKASEIAATAREKADELRGRASELADTTRDRASELAHTTRDKATDIAYATRDKAQEGGEAVETFIKENPIAAGAIALVIGAAIGLALPSTSKENEILGPKRDELAHKVADQALELKDRAQSVAQTALTSAKDSLAPVAETLKTNVLSAAEQVKTDAKDAVEQVKTDVQTAAENIKSEVKAEAETQGFGSGTATA